MSKLSNIRRAGFRAYRFIWIAKLMAFILSLRHSETYWVMPEHGCNMVLCIDDADRINKTNAKMKYDSMKKLRIRDLNRMSCFKYPKSWNKIKTVK